MLRRLSVTLLLAAPALTQELCLAEGTATSLTIATVPESNPNAPDTVVLQNVEFVPFEITGRTLAGDHDFGRSRRASRDGVVRVELPGGGRLFHYMRDGGQHWGFLHVAADGSARVVLEVPGAGLASPFLDQIGVAADGLHVVVPLVGGGASVVKLDGTTFASTGRADRQAVPAAQDLAPRSVMVGPTDFFYVTDINGVDKAFRCALADGAAPVDITPPATANDRIKDELAMSGDGLHVVFLHGPQNLQRMYHATTTGGSTALSPPPGKYEEPGYLPFAPGSPAMLLNEDGSRLFFVDAGVRDELYLHDMQGALPQLQITDDPIFQPYIGVFILPKFNANRLLVAIGDPGQMDWFHAELGATGGSVTNLTGTGSVLQPFPAGVLAPATGADAGASVLLVEQAAAGMNLRRLDPGTGANAIVRSDTALDFAVGSSFTAGADIVVAGAGGDTLFRGSSATPFGSTPAGVQLTAPVHGPLFSATQAHLLIPWGAPLFYLSNGIVIPGQIEFGLRQIVMTQAGGIVLNGLTVRYIDFGGTVTLQRPTAPVRLVLSGAGG